MNVKQDIIKFAAEDDKPVLLGLFSKYHTRTQWGFVASSRFRSTGAYSYQCDMVWSPTEEGRVLYEHLIKSPPETNELQELRTKIEELIEWYDVPKESGGRVVNRSQLLDGLKRLLLKEGGARCQGKCIKREQEA